MLRSEYEMSPDRIRAGFRPWCFRAIRNMSTASVRSLASASDCDETKATAASNAAATLVPKIALKRGVGPRQYPNSGAGEA